MPTAVKKKRNQTFNEITDSNSPDNKWLAPQEMSLCKGGEVLYETLCDMQYQSFTDQISMTGNLQE